MAQKRNFSQSFFSLAPCGLAATVVERQLLPHTCLTPEAESGSTLCRRTLSNAAAASHMSWHLTQMQQSELQDSAVMLISC